MTWRTELLPGRRPRTYRILLEHDCGYRFWMPYSYAYVRRTATCPSCYVREAYVLPSLPPPTEVPP